ncbi:methyltransferase [Flaviflexus huanghaiensis]|uniref:methyltransferase n=1 Tax=Flaviflexus huanghaiensis TaxID=1111473 RepID=UPI0015F9FDA2
MPDHYFSPQPIGPDRRREFRFTIRGDEFAVVTAGGVFSHDRIDRGTQVLLKYVDDPPQKGLLVDVGCGWGPITLALAAASPESTVLAVDVNERARELTAANVAKAGLTNVIVTDPEEALAIARERGIACIWSNPPVRIGKSALQHLLVDWFEHLEGYADIVIAKNLGADSLSAWLGTQGYDVKRIGSSGGFRVLRVSGPPQPAQSA